MKTLFLLKIVLLSFLFVACSESGSSTDSSEKEEKQEVCVATTEVTVFKSASKLTPIWSVTSINNQPINNPVALAYDKKRAVIYVAHENATIISKLSVDGNSSSLKSISPWISGLSGVSAMSIVEDTLFVADKNRVREYNLTTINQSTNNLATISNDYIDNSVTLNDIAVDSAKNIYLSVDTQNKLYKITSDTEYGEVNLDKDFDATLYLSNINSLYESDCNLIVGGASPYLSKLIESSSSVTLINNETNMDPTNITSIDLYNLNSSNNRAYLVVDDNREIKIVYDVNKTIRDLTDGVIGDDRVGRVTFIRDSNTLVVPTKAGNSVEAYKID